MKKKSARATKPKPEKVIQASILKYLKSTGLLHWRQNSGCLFLYGRMVKLGEKGLPDIIIIVPPTGRFFGMEIKSEKGRLRPAQKEFSEKLIDAGGAYRVVRSLKEAKEALNQVLYEEAA